MSPLQPCIYVESVGTELLVRNCFLVKNVLEDQLETIIKHQKERTGTGFTRKIYWKNASICNFSKPDIRHSWSAGWRLSTLSVSARYIYTYIPIYLYIIYIINIIYLLLEIYNDSYSNISLAYCVNIAKLIIDPDLAGWPMNQN